METYTGSAWSTSDLPATGASGNLLSSTGTAWTSVAQSTITAGNVSGTVAVTNGGTGLTTTTTAYGVLAAGTTTTGALQNIGTGTSAQVLTSNGSGALPTFQALPASGGMTLLGTITPTAVNSISLTGLTLTSYKAIFIGVTRLGGTGNQACYVSATNIQTGGGAGSLSSTQNYWGTSWIDLSGGGMGGSISNDFSVGSGTNFFGPTGITTASTAIYFRMGGSSTFVAQGSILIYGVK
jgi:hypothetical protein